MTNEDFISKLLQLQYLNNNGGHCPEEIVTELLDTLIDYFDEAEESEEV